MRNIVRFSVFSLFLVPFSVFAQDWVGFKKVEGNSDIPHQAEVLASVFQVHSYNAVSEAKFEVVTTSKQKQVTKTDVLDTDPRALQIETCRRYGMEKCPVSTRRSSSTVVLSGGTKLQGCRHSFHNWLAMGSKLNNIPIQSMHVPMVIMNYKGEVVYNSAYSPADYEISFINTSDRLNVVFDGEKIINSRPKFYGYTALADSITLSFSSDVVTTTSSFSYSPPVKGNSVYVYGYPAKTNYFGGVKKGDAPGDVLVASSGVVTELPGQKKRVFTNAKSGPGASGGPILDSEGSLLGFVCADKDGAANGPINKDDAILVLWDLLEGMQLD